MTPIPVPKSVLIAILFAGAAMAQPITCAATRASKAAFPQIPTTIDSTCTVMPVQFAGQVEQPNFDLFGWLTFLALNWPANTTTCQANAGASILSGTGPVVWETYLEDSDLFVGPGLMPVAWCNSYTAAAARTSMIQRLPAKVRPLAQQHPEVHLVLHQNSKAGTLLKSKLTLSSDSLRGIFEAVGGPLTDQAGRFVRYAIHINQDEYNYIRNNGLWHKAGLLQYNQPISFPDQQSSYGPVGAMEIKAAWKVLCTTSTCKPQDNPSHFYTEQAIVYNDDTGAPSPGPNPVTVGLVGLHITHKVPNQPTWMWITFQQSENAVTFFNRQCNFQCAPNTQTAAKPYTELKPDGTPVNKGVQVAVVPANDSSVQKYNQGFKKLLGSSVWSWYEQMSVQWTGETPPNPKPLLLGNPVLETYIQGSSSCLSCHNLSTVTTKKGTVPADFSFLFYSAQ